ncbi:HNH endonuclease [Xanthobacteraceae bacterium A53D]
MTVRSPFNRPAAGRSKRDQRVSARKRGYDSRWDKARATFLAEPENCLCVRCKANGILNPGTLRMDGAPEPNPRRRHLVVDHIVPHKGDQKLFWDRSNWQALCPDHHDIAKQQEEGRGFASGSDLSGRPIDPAHPWNRRQG